MVTHAVLYSVCSVLQNFSLQSKLNTSTRAVVVQLFCTVQLLVTWNLVRFAETYLQNCTTLQ